MLDGRGRGPGELKNGPLAPVLGNFVIVETYPNRL